MSANCIALAYELIAVGKKPELARTYGILNGGIKAQLCMAHPVVTTVEGNLNPHVSQYKFLYLKQTNIK